MAPTTYLPPVHRKHLEHRLPKSDESKAALARFAKSLRTLRKAQGFTLTELADKVGCSLKQISNIEHEHCWPGMPVYLAICKALGQPKPPML